MIGFLLLMILVAVWHFGVGIGDGLR